MIHKIDSWAYQNLETKTKFRYFSLHLNHIFFRFKDVSSVKPEYHEGDIFGQKQSTPHYHYGSPEIRKDVIDKISNSITNDNSVSKDVLIIFDFDHFFKASKGNELQSLNNLIKSGYKIILFNLNEDLATRCYEEFLKGQVAYVDTMLVSTTHKSDIEDTYYDNNAIADELKNVTDSLIRDTFEDYCIENDQPYLPSSNVYSNKYIDIKALFNHIEVFRLTILKLCKLVEKLEKFDYFVVGSRNGSCIASILSRIFNKEVKYILTLGPCINLKNKFEIEENKRYVYVYDFICLGSEYRFMKALIEMGNGTFVGGVGIGKYCDPIRSSNSDIKVKASDCVVDINKDNFEYEIRLENAFN